MTAEFMADATIRDLYGIEGVVTFENTFSPVSLESIIFYIVATCAYVVESLFDRHREEVATIASQSIVATVPWYYSQALAYQHGDALQYDAETGRWGYAVTDTAKQVVKFVAVRDRGTSVQILVSGEKDKRPVALENAILTPFTRYMNSIKIAGVMLSVRSYDADQVKVTAQITIDPLVLDSTGKKIDGGSYPVRDAITQYLYNIIYGGTLNKQKLVDAIQAVPGVVDVVLVNVEYSLDGASYQQVTGNNYTARAGCFVPVDLENTLTYGV